MTKYKSKPETAVLVGGMMDGAQKEINLADHWPLPTILDVPYVVNPKAEDKDKLIGMMHYKIVREQGLPARDSQHRIIYKIING